MQRFRLVYVFSCLLVFGCARDNFYQSSALHLPANAQPGPDSAVVVAGQHYDRGWWHQLWWGGHYRDVWAQPVTLKVFKTNEAKGGLYPEKLGGGFQTTSLTLANPDGKEFALRSVDKDPQKVLPKGLRSSFATNVLRDQTSAGHPYAATVVSGLSMAAKIPHAHPQYVYVPEKVKGLEEFAPVLKDRVFLLEEKFEGPEAINRYLGKAENLVDSEVFLYNRFNFHGHRADQTAFAKARLFDILIGDWDRHEGQWQWAVYDSAGFKTYAPIPKDRDQAFFLFDDGLLPWLFSRSWGPLSKMKSFHRNISSVKGYLQNASFIDQRVLNEVTAQEWDQLALELQSQLTDSALQNAVTLFPTAVYKLSGQEIEEKLRSRRNQLPQIARQVYKLLAEHVLVPGTDQEELFEVERQPDGQTLVKVYQKPSTETGKPFKVYERLFDPNQTKSIALYGLGKADEFTLKGKGNKGIIINIYGGEGEDKVTDSSFVKGWGRLTRVFDTKRGVEVEKGKETRLKLSKTVEVHAFDREGL